MRSARLTFWMLYGGVGALVGFLALLEHLITGTTVRVMSAPAALWLLFGWWPVRLVLPLFLTSVSCPHCGEQYELVGRWSCSCGYTSNRESHLLRFTCPLCSKQIGWINCARCESTILIR